MFTANFTESKYESTIFTGYAVWINTLLTCVHKHKFFKNYLDLYLYFCVNEMHSLICLTTQISIVQRTQRCGVVWYNTAVAPTHVHSAPLSCHTRTWKLSVSSLKWHCLSKALSGEVYKWQTVPVRRKSLLHLFSSLFHFFFPKHSLRPLRFHISSLYQYLFTINLKVITVLHSLLYQEPL